LAVEVSDATLGFDLSGKAALYARAGIVEYWALDINAHRMIVHRDPKLGKYVSAVAYSANESVASLTASRAWLPVKDLFPEEVLAAF
jgi:Uma2 family endonuclease